MKSNAYILKGKKYIVDLDNDRLFIETLGQNTPDEVCVLSAAMVPEEIAHFVTKLRTERLGIQAANEKFEGFAKAIGATGNVPVSEDCDYATYEAACKEKQDNEAWIGHEIKAGRIPQMQCSSCGSPLVNNTHCLVCRNRIENLSDRIIEAGKVFSGATPLPISPFSNYTPEQKMKFEMEQMSIRQAERNKAANDANEFTGNKYHRKIVGLDGTVTTIDVYRVIDSFDVREPGLQHAIKKLLCAGMRGKNDVDNDLKEAIDAITATRLSIKQKIGLQP